MCVYLYTGICNRYQGNAILNHAISLICTIYRSPVTDSADFRGLTLIVKEIPHANPYTLIWIGRNLNLPNIERSTNSITDNGYPLALCNQILEFMSDYRFLIDNSQQLPKITAYWMYFYNIQPSTIESCEIMPDISDLEIVCHPCITNIIHSEPTSRNTFLCHNTDFAATNNYIAQFYVLLFNT